MNGPKMALAARALVAAGLCFSSCGQISTPKPAALPPGAAAALPPAPPVYAAPWIEKEVPAPWGRTFLCRDDFFTNTNTNVTRRQFHDTLTNMAKARLLPWHLDFIYDQALANRLNPWLLLVKMEQESSTVWCNVESPAFEDRLSRCMGYACHMTKDPANNNRFQHQVAAGARTLRLWYDEWRPGAPVRWQRTHEDQSPCTPENASTWALYKYTPAYGRCTYAEYPGLEENGNAVFCIVLERMLVLLPNRGMAPGVK